MKRPDMAPVMKQLQTAEKYLRIWQHILDDAILRAAVRGWPADACALGIDPGGKVGLYIGVTDRTFEYGQPIPGTLVYEQWLEVPTLPKNANPPSVVELHIRHKWHVDEIPRYVDSPKATY